MSKYLKSEIYRVFHNRGSYLFLLVCSIMMITSNVVLAAIKARDAAFPYATTKFSFMNIYANLPFLFMLTIAVGFMVFSNEFQSHTMKNTISFGITRRTVYCSKFIVEILYAVIALLIIMGVHIASSYLLLENSGIKRTVELLRALLAALPLLINGIAITNAMLFCIEGTGGAIGAAIGIMMGLPTVCSILGMRFDVFVKIGSYLPYNILSEVHFDEATGSMVTYWDTALGMGKCWMIGLAESLVVLLIGYYFFRKREIK